MKIILTEDVKNVGKKGETVEVKDGFGRNLLSKKQAMEATGANLNDMKLKKANDDKVAAEQLQAAKDMAAVIETKSVKLSVKTGENGKSFGSISTKEISQGAKEQHGLDIDKKKIVLKDAIKFGGCYEVTVKLHPKVTAKLKVEVTEE
ncbi:MAG: 50S ribosomal protein L9 [Lachnospiraceae bacterium]|nr:50S ribosomal protein L9 [Lachnospiraceae bacterium]